MPFWSVLLGLWPYLLIAVQVTGILFAIDAIMRGRTPQGTIAWALGLVTFPLLAIPLYLAFGSRRFYGYISARRRGDRRLADLGRRVCELMLPARRSAAAESSDPSDDADPHAVLERLARLPATDANAVSLLIDGPDTFAALLAAIDRAQRYILVQFYIIRDDRIGSLFQEHLLTAAARGVRVYLLYDDVGSASLSRAWLRRLEDAGCAVAAFKNSRIPRNRFKINFRNHRKVVVIDGHEALVGGHNIGDEYLGRDDTGGPWRDTHLGLTGPAVAGAQLAFVEDWQWATGAVPELHWSAEPGSAAGVAENAPDTDQRVLVVPSGPADDVETCHLLFSHLITTARRRLWIATPYFVPDEGIINALQLAALRGVDVRVIMPRRPDSFLVALSHLTFDPQSVGQGVKLYRYNAGFLHQKCVLSDDVAAIGTANFDNRSFRINFEITVVVRSQPFIAQVQTMLHRDFERCHRVGAGDFAQRHAVLRFAARCARLLAPLQ